jgi:hypothetical protein
VEKLGSGTAVSRSRIRIADIDGEEFEEAGLGPFPAFVISAGRPADRPAVFLMTTKSPMPDRTTSRPIYYPITSFMSDYIDRQKASTRLRS